MAAALIPAETTSPGGENSGQWPLFRDVRSTRRPEFRTIPSSHLDGAGRLLRSSPGKALLDVVVSRLQPADGVNPKTRRNSFLLVLLSLLASTAWAKPLPSFDLWDVSWQATHILVVTEGERIDGNVEVLASWKGDLPEGTVLRIPYLAVYKDPSRRVTAPWWWERTEGPDQPPSSSVTGSRMVLFLRETKADGAERSRWMGASSTSGMNVSVVWIEKDESYAFIQQINPGDSLLTALKMSEDELKDHVAEILETRDEFERSLRLGPEKRAQALGQLVHSEIFPARVTAFEELEHCGEAALPVLRELLRDESLPSHAEIVQIMARVGGDRVGPELTALVASELEHWRQVAPALQPGWWNALSSEPEQTSALRERYTILLEALRGLKEIRYRGAESIVTELRDFWLSLPQLEDPSGLDQMSRECDALLDAGPQLQ